MNAKRNRYLLFFALVLLVGRFADLRGQKELPHKGKAVHIVRRKGS